MEMSVDRTFPGTHIKFPLNAWSAISTLPLMALVLLFLPSVNECILAEHSGGGGVYVPVYGTIFTNNLILTNTFSENRHILVEKKNL